MPSLHPTMVQAGIQPIALRTEYRENPLGIAATRPRLSWEIQPRSLARGLRQTAYHLLVAGDLARLTPGQADLWDSGETVSCLSAHLVYGGRTLSAREICHWTVRLRDQAGRWSGWSEPARWTMGALGSAFWSAKWIGTGESLTPPGNRQPLENTLPDMWYRRTVTLDAAPQRATMFVASVGFHELYVNGVKAGDAVLAPNVTDNSKRARYLAYEIGPLLRSGRNTLGLWLGTGWSIYPKFSTSDKPRAPIVLAQCDLDLPGGRTQRIVTDEAWLTLPSPSRLLGSWDFKNYGGELYDANSENPAWVNADFDDASWKAAVVVTSHLAVSADEAEPNTLSTELRAVEVRQNNGTARIDMGRNYAGWIELPLRGEPGRRIELQFSERSDRAMTHQMRSIYIVGPAGGGVFRNRFNYSAGRWVTISGLKNELRPEQVRGWVVRSAYASAAHYECSNPLFNDIFATTRWTFENVTLGGYVVDCPHRERMGYGGDAHATTTTGLSLFRLGAFYQKWSEDWRDAQGHTPTWGVGTPPGEAGGDGHEEGNLPYAAPTYWGGGGPAWSGYCVHLPWEIYRRYGDEQILRDNLATIERWLAFLETKTQGGLLGRYGGEWDFLGDWLWPGAQGTNGDTAEALFFNNCYWIYNLQIAAAIARIAGRSDLLEMWSRRAAGLRQAVHARFFNPADASYVNGFQAYLAMALLVDVPPPVWRPAVWRRLEHEILVVRSGHIHAGITGGTFLFQLLMQAGRDDLIFAMVNRDDPPGWGAMLRQGATTFWESWEEHESADSQLHSSFLYVGAWFIHGVLGIQPDPEVPGFRSFVIRPGVTDHPSLTWARGHYDSIRGRIMVSWRREKGRFHLDAQVPPNTETRLELPAARLDEITESGHPLPVAAGVISMRIDKGRAVLQLASGNYRFTC